MRVVLAGQLEPGAEAEAGHHHGPAGGRAGGGGPPGRDAGAGAAPR